MALDARSEEEKKKRREAFERGRANLGLGANNQAAGFMSAGQLAQQARQQIPAQNPARPSPQMATQLAARKRDQDMAQQRQAQARQSANRAAAVQETRGNIQDVLKLPAKDQPQAAAGLGQNTPARNNAASPSLGLMPAAQAAAPSQPAERLTELGGGVRKPATDAKIKLDFPISNQSNGEDKWNPKNYPSVYAGRQAIPEEAVPSSYVDQPAQTNSEPARIGFDPVNNPQAIKSNVGNGFRMPNAPTRTWSERQEREALLRDSSTAYKGSQNGQLTAKQMELRAGIIGADDKYKNDQYGAQLSAASQMAQAQMSQDGANQRAVLGETGTNARLNSQLGFDAAKFQQTAEQQQQANGLASRRLDIEQGNSDIANFAPKQLNSLYEKYDTAQSDEDRSAIAAQIQALKGTNTNSDKEYWTNIGGGETLSPDGLASTKNPDILLNRNTGETRAIPTEPIDYANDPRAIAIKNNTSLSSEERRKQLEALR